MDSSSNDPLYYLKVIAENSEWQQKQSQKGIRIAIAVLVITILIGGISSAILSSLFTKKVASSAQSLDWYDVSRSMHQGDFNKALEMADQWLSQNPRDFDALYTKGKIQLILGDRDGAFKSFQAAYDLFPIPKHKEAVDALKPKAAVNAARPTAPSTSPAKPKI